jgi:2-enoate reductase
MYGRYEPLFQPWQVGSVTIKNRFVLCPLEGTNMINWEAKTGFNYGVETFYRERAKDGIGLMIPGAIPMLSIVGSKCFTSIRKCSSLSGLLWMKSTRLVQKCFFS